MRRLPLLPALRIWFLLFASTAAKARITPSSSLLDSDDATALLDFKEKLGGGGTSLLSWNGSTHFCTGQGVTCSRRHPERGHGHRPPRRGFVGPISPVVGNLSFLRSINLSSNALHGEIPSSIGRLRRLQYLDLSSNSISGEIPMGICNCSELRSTSPAITTSPSWAPFRRLPLCRHLERERWFEGEGYEAMHVQGRRWSGDMGGRFNPKKGMAFEGSIFDAGPIFESYGVAHG
ncbi:hypothetical protein ZIOFF_051612 [Zingiber officinale]|uniref:Leucine-rich repeat-containing N-terminal plant-type domain-containing protein n=1 Tax=Zingiber officinale TaxID=94328 RepID=A0A8J5KUR7_ZINOF|nr:hypothetical protein ZIOFF_051612 [Zingiber officinale]